jgi:hypothetical protein
MNLPLTLLTIVADEYYVPVSLPHLSYLLPLSHPSPLTHQPTTESGDYFCYSPL